jgi:hypothetical protein
MELDDRSGSKAALTASNSNFRFTESGLNSDIAPCPKSAKLKHQALAYLR